MSILGIFGICLYCFICFVIPLSILCMRIWHKIEAIIHHIQFRLAVCKTWRRYAEVCVIQNIQKKGYEANIEYRDLIKKSGCYTVGFNDNGIWTPESDWDTEEEAKEQVKYLLWLYSN